MEDILKKKLIGEQLSSIEFVQDYLQIHFDDKNFIIYIWPIVYQDGNKYIFGEENFRNALCELIGLDIKDVVFKESERLKIIFDTKNIIEIDLNSENPDIVSKIAIFNDTLDNSWSVFE